MVLGSGPLYIYVSFQCPTADIKYQSALHPTYGFCIVFNLYKANNTVLFI